MIMAGVSLDFSKAFYAYETPKTPKNKKTQLFFGRGWGGGVGSKIFSEFFGSKFSICWGRILRANLFLRPKSLRSRSRPVSIRPHRDWRYKGGSAKARNLQPRTAAYRAPYYKVTMSTWTQVPYAGQAETKQLVASVRDNLKQYRLCGMKLIDAKEEEAEILLRACTATGRNDIPGYTAAAQDLERIRRAIKDIKSAYISAIQMSNTLIKKMHNQVDRNSELAGSTSASFP